MRKLTLLFCAIAIAMGAYAASNAVQTTTDEGWSEWEPFAPLGLSTGTYTARIMFLDIQTTVPVEVRTSLTDSTHKQIKMNDWGKIAYEETQDIVVDWFTENDSCVFPNINVTTYDIYGLHEYELFDVAYLGISSESHYDPSSATFTFHIAADGYGLIGPAFETLEMNRVYTERDTVDINLKNLDVFGVGEGYEEHLYLVETDEYVIEIFTTTDKLYGTFKVSDGSLCIDSRISTIYTKDGEFTITQTENGRLLSGWIIGQDEVYYRLNLSGKTGGLVGDEQEDDIDFLCDWASLQWSIENGIAYFSATDKLKNLNLALFVPDTATIIPAGVYPISETPAVGTAFKSIGLIDGLQGGNSPCSFWVANTPYNKNRWFMVEGAVTVSYDQYGKMNMLVEGKNSYGKNIHAVVKYEKFTPKDTATIVANDLQVKYVAYNNYFEFKTMTNDTTVCIFVTPVDFHTPAGEYKDHAVYCLNSMVLLPRNYSFFDCEFTVTLEGTDLALTGWALARDTVLYNLNLTGHIDGLEHEANRDYTGVFDLDEAVITQPDDYVATLTVTNDNNEKLVLQFYSILIMDDRLNAGEYRIDIFIQLAEGDQVVLPSAGMEDGELYPSYVAKLDEQGNPIETWFIEAGKVEVVGDLSTITVDAVNSLYKTINITISKGVTALPNVNSKLKIQNSKLIKDGQLFIRKNGKTYTIEGVTTNL